MDLAVTIIGSILGGGALLTFIQFLINRQDERNGKQDLVLKAISKVQEELEEFRNEFSAYKAEVLRYNILNFNDSILELRVRGKDSWNQILQDITDYEVYCHAHPDFKNDRANLAIENIKERYKQEFYEE